MGGYAATMLEATFWGFVGGGALILGAAAGLWLHASQRVIGLIMAFGAGVLISALAFELTEQAFEVGGADAVAGGLGAGALVFFLGDWWIDARGGDNRKRSGGEQADGSARAIVLGAVLDGIPESAAIGLTIVEGGSVSGAVVAAVFLSNIPESLSAATGLQTAGHSRRWILGMWTVVAVVSALAAGAGYAAMGDASGDTVAFTQAFAAGAVLTMLADTMMPEAFKHGGRVTGLFTVLGFALAFLLSSTG
jgi:zinc transporter, ZIP family